MPKGQKLKKSGIKKETNNNTTFSKNKKQKNFSFALSKTLKKKVEANFFPEHPSTIFLTFATKISKQE